MSPEQNRTDRIRTHDYMLAPDTVYRLLVARTFGGQIRIYAFNGVLIALIVASLVYAAFDVSQAVALGVLIGLLAVVGVALSYPLWRYRQYVNAPSNAHLFAQVTVEIDPQFIAVHHANGQIARTPLPSVSRAIVTREYWLLYVGKLIQHVIPVTAFAAPGDAQRLEQWLRKNRVFIQFTRRG